MAQEDLSETKEQDDLSQMITPIATSKIPKKISACCKFYLNKESTDFTECRMASVTNQKEMSCEAQTELVNHLIESFSLIDKCS